MLPEDNNDNLVKLKRLTDELSSFSHLARKSAPGYIELEVDEGSAFSFSLYDCDHVGVTRWYCSAGVFFPPHTHKEKLWIFLYRGKMQITLGGGKEEVLEAVDSIYVAPGLEHKVRFLKDSWYIAITMPRSKGGPDYGCGKR